MTMILGYWLEKLWLASRVMKTGIVLHLSSKMVQFTNLSILRIAANQSVLTISMAIWMTSLEHRFYQHTRSQAKKTRRIYQKTTKFFDIKTVLLGHSTGFLQLKEL